MDLGKLEVPETAIIHIEYPGVGKLYKDEARTIPCTIEVYGPSSNEFIAYKRKATKRMQDRLGKKGLKAFGQIPPEELEDMEVEKLAMLTVAVNNIELNGNPVTTKNVIDVYRDARYGWLREQVSEKLGGWEDFLNQ